MLEDGSVVALKCLGHLAGNTWLDGITQLSRTALAPDQMAHDNSYSGTWWLVHDDGSALQLQTLGHLRGDRWLNGITQTGGVNLVNETSSEVGGRVAGLQPAARRPAKASKA